MSTTINESKSTPAFASRLKRRISSDVLLPPANHGTSSSASLSNSESASSYFLQFPPTSSSLSLHAKGQARLIFRSSDPQWFDGVLITDDGEETFSIRGSPNKKFLSEENDRRSVDVSITDGETGQLYIIRRVELLPPRNLGDTRGENDEDGDGSTMCPEGDMFGDSTAFKTLSKPKTFSMNFPQSSTASRAELELGVSLDSSTRAVLHENYNDAPRFELRSDVLTFTTADILIGNRADKEIRAYLNPALVGRLLNVHVGPMNVAFDTPVTPPPTTAAFDRYRRRRHSSHISICAANATACDELMGKLDDMEAEAPSDADINFLM